MAAEANPATPAPYRGLHHDRMWESIARRSLELQRCDGCGKFRYPASPVCDACLGEACTWTPVSGLAEALSWVRYHRSYFPAYPAPHVVVAARLAEGPIFIAGLAGVAPDEIVGRAVHIDYREMPDGVVLPIFAPVGEAVREHPLTGSMR